MTCSQCRYEFCWLCMGDYRNHQAETGRYLGNSFEDVKAAGRETKDMTDAAKIERELKRLDHYKTRYIEHFKSINISEKAATTMLNQITTAIEVNPDYSMGDYQFLLDISKLIITVRRGLTYTYPIRFYLKGPNKQSFFDFIQGELEASLEKLNKRMEENWLEKLDYNEMGKLIIGRKFNDYKAQVVDLRVIVQNHFNQMMKDIMSGLPHIKEDDDAEDDDYTFDGSNSGTIWTCRVCQVKNDMKNVNCTTCRSARPNLSYAATVKPGVKKQKSIKAAASAAASGFMGLFRNRSQTE